MYQRGARLRLKNLKRLFVGLIPSGLVHICRQNRELLSIDEVLRLFIDKMQLWMRDKKFLILLDLFRSSLQTKSEICLQTIADFVYKCVLSLNDEVSRVDIDVILVMAKVSIESTPRRI